MAMTHDELQIILEAKKQGKDIVNIEIQTEKGSSWAASFCGKCGRIIHNPDCPEMRNNSGNV